MFDEQMLPVLLMAISFLIGVCIRIPLEELMVAGLARNLLGAVLAMVIPLMMVYLVTGQFLQLQPSLSEACGLVGLVGWMVGKKSSAVTQTERS